MNRFLTPLLFCLTCLCLQAQTSGTITISTSPAGARFIVDGQTYNSAVTLVWPAGSTHIVAFVIDQPVQGQATTVQTSLDGSTQYAFGGWKDNAGLLVPSTDPVQVVTANTSITTLTAAVTVSYRVLLNFYNSGNPGDPVTCGISGAPGVNTSTVVRPGVVYLGSTCYWATTPVFIAANSVIPINAIPYPGFVFLGWTMSSGQSAPYLSNLTVDRPLSITPMFSAGKRVRFLTSPLGMKVMIDHTVVPTLTLVDPTQPGCPDNETQPEPPQATVPPLCLGEFDFAGGSKHTLGAVSPQVDVFYSGKWQVFDHWSNGMGANAVYTTDYNLSASDTLTAMFVPGASVILVTKPAGLKLSVDGRENWPNYTFIWGLGSTHQIAALPTQFDASGRQYTFQSWSNGGSMSQNITVDQNLVNQPLLATANYSVLSRVVLQTSPPGLTVQVDGTNCQTPCNVDRPNGASLHITAPNQVPMGVGARLDFASWSDGGTADHTFLVNQDLTTLTATYTTSYQLSAASDPANGISFQVNPSSPDMFFPQNAQVTITATANPGFKFRRWSGDLSGTFPVGGLTMNVPRSVVAQADTVPYIPPAGITNVVGITPSGAVSPGSIMAITGQNLAPDTEVGRVNPLAQIIGGVTVTLNDRILGLVSISPQQINAQVPSDLPDGNYTLWVHSTGQPDVSATFTISRDAPGLFFQTLNQQSYAVAFHADGSQVTPDNPAVAEETVSVLGSGFGPYTGKIIDGFFPPSPPPALADALTISLADQNPAASWAGAAAGLTGLTLTQFQIPDGMPSASNVSLKVTVNGVDSNTVVLPLQ